MDRKSPVTREQAEAEELAAIGQEILINARNELYLNMRYMDVALSALFPVPDYAVRGLQTDGISLFFHPRDLAALYRRGRAEVNRAYLHMIFHCLFGHFSGARDPRWGNELIWDVACDVAAELLTDGLPYRCVHRHPSPLKREFTARLAEEVSVVTAQSVYRYLEKRQFAVQYLLRLRQEFFVDDHSLWRDSPNSDKNQRQGKNNDWDDIREHMETEMETLSKEAGGGSEGLLEQVKIGNRERYDYRDFLQKFTRLKETLKVDTDSFDYIYYDYGMRTYGNMPLIEPLETKELRRIEEFVIVIDTSMSCSGSLVKRILEETCSVLNQRESFFERANIHIIQCDDRVQRDTPIRSREEMVWYMEHLEIAGKGGTDFRPAFQYVDGLIASGELTALRGLLYFTDGYGLFPVKMPSYDTAFIFMKDDYRDVDVPAWAIKIILDPDDLGPVEEIK